jgi:hypothetical protein
VVMSCALICIYSLPLHSRLRLRLQFFTWIDRIETGQVQLCVMNDITTQPGVQGAVYLRASILLYLIKLRLIHSRGGGNLAR